MARGKHRNTPSPRRRERGEGCELPLSVAARTPPPAPSLKGRGCFHRPIPHCPIPYRPILAPTHPRPPATAPTQEQLRGLGPGGVGVRRRLGRLGQDQAADRPPAAPDARRRAAGAHPVPDLHQGGRGGNGGAAAAHARPVGDAGRRAAGPRPARSGHRIPRPDLRQRARALFARVLDLPGGMRIGTIHAFCQSLLRRFPLEAALSPHFQLVDERDAADALTEAREAMLAEAHTEARRDALRRSPAWPPPTNSAATSMRCRPTASAWPLRWPARSRRGAAPRAGHRRQHARRRSSPPASTGRRSATCARPPASSSSSAPRPAPSAPGASWTGSAWTARPAPEGELDAVVHRVPHRQRARRARRSGFVSKAVTDRHPDLAQVFLAEAERILAI